MIFNSQRWPLFLSSPMLCDVTPRLHGQRNWHEYIDNSELAGELLCKNERFLIFLHFQASIGTYHKNMLQISCITKKK